MTPFGEYFHNNSSLDLSLYSTQGFHGMDEG